MADYKGSEQRKTARTIKEAAAQKAGFNSMLEAEEAKRIAKQMGNDCCQGVGECELRPAKRSLKSFTPEEPPRLVLQQPLAQWGENWFYRGVLCEDLPMNFQYNRNHKVETLTGYAGGNYTVYRQPDYSYIIIKLAGNLKLRAVKQKK